MEELLCSADPRFELGVSNGYMTDLEKNVMVDTIFWMHGNNKYIMTPVRRGNKVNKLPQAPASCSERSNMFVGWTDDEDYFKFVETLENYKAVSEYKVFAYCHMSNHIHILIKVEKEDLDLIMKRIAGSYVYWYNWKYYRKGHLFQDRFKSEPVEDNSYFLTVLRYIHQNPVKAGVVKSIDEYRFSSYNDYVDEDSDIVDIDFVLSFMKKDEFIVFNGEKNDDVCLDIDPKGFRINDSDAKKIIKNKEV